MPRTTTSRILASILVSLILILLPAFYWFEQEKNSTWVARLLLPVFEEELPQHSPRYSQGTYLPARITKDTRLQPNQNPVLIAGITTIAPGVTLTVTAGTHLYFHEFGVLQVEGQLVVTGSDRERVVFASNERNPSNQAWGGITMTSSGTGTIDYAHIEDASPAISCLSASTFKGTDITILRGVVGWFTASMNCTLADSTINGARDGIVAVGVEPNYPATTISARKNTVRRLTPPTTSNTFR